MLCVNLHKTKQVLLVWGVILTRTTEIFHFQLVQNKSSRTANATCSIAAVCRLKTRSLEMKRRVCLAANTPWIAYYLLQSAQHYHDRVVDSALYEVPMTGGAGTSKVVLLGKGAASGCGSHCCGPQFEQAYTTMHL
jgi:hypothetical protein